MIFSARVITVLTIAAATLGVGGTTASASQVEPSFAPSVTGSPSNINRVAVQPSDGKILIGGFFSAVDGITRTNLARLNTDGTLDTGFNPDINGAIQSIAVQSDGKILIGGNFSTINSTARSSLARLNADGTLDSFNPGANAVVNSIAVQSDGKILIGGQFDTVALTNRNRLARLNADGTLDTGFDPNVTRSAGPNANVSSIAVQSDNKILIGGRFDFVGGTARTSLARLNSDGTLDSGFVANTNDFADVFSIAMQSDGKILVGGIFFEIDGTARESLARLDANGDFDNGFAGNTDGEVRSIAVLPNGQVLVGGAFNQAGGVARASLARFNADGTTDTDFVANANNTVRSIVVQSNGRALVGGPFTSIGGETRTYVARLLPAAAPTTYQLSVAKSGTGTGTVTSSPAGIDCGSTCQADFSDGASVTLNAAATSGSTFTGWSGSGCSGTGSCAVTMSEARSVTATFDLAPGPGPDPGPTPSGEPKLALSIKTPKKAKAGKGFEVQVTTRNVATSASTRQARVNGDSSPTTAKQVKTCAKLPKGLFVVKRGGGKVKGQTICWTRSSLPAGESATYKATVRYSKSSSGSIKVSGTVSASNSAGDPVSTTGSARIRIVEPKPRPKPKPPTG